MSLAPNIAALAPLPNKRGPLSGNGPPITNIEKLPVDWDEDNPRSIPFLLTDKMRDRVMETKRSCEDLIDMDEVTLLSWLKANKAQPNKIDNRLRMMFWVEYDRAQHMGKQMVAQRIYAGVVSRPYFYQKFLRNPHKVAWMLCIPTGYDQKMAEALEFALEQMRDILEADHWYTVKGSTKQRLDVNVAKLKMDLMRHLDIRVQGATVMEVRQQTLQINTTPKEIEKLQSMGDINKELKKLETKAEDFGSVAHKPQLIDASEVPDGMSEVSESKQSVADSGV